MNNFIAVHHTHYSTNFMYADSVEEARTHLVSLVKSRLSRPTDTMAIVCVWDNSPIYHQSGRNTVDSLMAEPMYAQSYSDWNAIWEQFTMFCKGAWRSLTV